MDHQSSRYAEPNAAEPNANSYGYGDCYSDCDAYCHSDTDSYPDCDSYRYCYRDSNVYTRTELDPTAYTHAERY